MKNIYSLITALVFVLVLLPVQAYASDLEVYQGGGTDAKVLLVLDASGSMLLKDAIDVEQVIDYSETRMQTLYNALESVLEDPELFNNPDLSVGLSYFGGVMGSGIKFPVSPLSLPANQLIDEIPEGSDKTVKDVLLSIVDGIFPRDPEIYDPEGFDMINAQLYNTTYGYTHMADVPPLDVRIDSFDWSWTADTTATYGSPAHNGYPPYWYERVPTVVKDDHDNIVAIPPGGSAWTSEFLPLVWMQECPEPPEFSGDTYYQTSFGGDIKYHEFEECDLNGSRWDPDRCKVEGFLQLGEDGTVPGYEDDNGIPLDRFDEDGNPATPEWRHGGFPGEWSSCRPGELTMVHGKLDAYFTLYNDTRELLTPTVDALYEATRYFRGDRVFHGSRDHFPPWNQDKFRYVSFPEDSFDYPAGEAEDPEISDAFTHGYPGDLEVLGVPDKEVFTNSVTSRKKTTGGLWGWRAANPLTYADEDGGNDGPRRNYLPVSSWSAGDADDTLDEEKHYLKNSIFKYDCDYRIGKTKGVDKNDDDNDGNRTEEFEFPQWSYMFQSFYGCNLVDGDQLFEYPTVTSEADLISIRYGGTIGGITYIGDDDEKRAIGDETEPGDIDNPGPGPKPPNDSHKADVLTDASKKNLDCRWEYNLSQYCPDKEVTGDGTSNSSADNCSEDLVITSHYERKCDFRYESAKLYQSPIGECSNSSIILITDGHPTANTVDNNNYAYSAGSIGETDPDLKLDDLFASNLRGHNVRMDTPGLIRDLIEIESCTDIFTGLGDPMNLDDSQVALIVKHEINKSGGCAFELAKYLKDNNQRPDVSNIGTVTTNTVGFQLSATDPALTFLEGIADAGGGLYASANNEAELVAAIKSMISAASKDTSDTSSVAVSLDSNTLTSAKEAYAPVFKSTKNNIWDANVKGYYLYAKPQSVEEDMLLGSGIRSFWSDDSTYTGNKQVLAGGLNKVIMPPATYTSMLLNDTADRSTWSYPDHTTLGRAENVYAEREEWDVRKWDLLKDLEPTDFGYVENTDANEAKKDGLLDFIMAQPLGDSLHTKPVSIEYNDNKYLVVVSNAGFLHTFRLNPNIATNGDIDYHTNEPTELTAWIPHSLLSNLKKQKNNNTNSTHVYGLDSPLRIWNPTVEVDGVSVKKTFAFFGMRRGGSSYYMLDLTNPEYPTVVWRIDSGDANFQALGESWSPITLFKVNDADSDVTLDVSGEQKLHGFDDTYVAVFGGGYRTNFEDNAELTRDEIKNKKGRGLYVINPLTGELYRSFGNGNAEKFTKDINEMRWGVPAEIRAIDVDGNGYGDRLYFGDMGGQLWRVDIDASAGLTTESAYYVKLLADFGVNLESSTADGDTEDEVKIDEMRNHRRFYTVPAVAFAENGNLAIAIGSGYRAHPLQGSASDEATVTAIEDRFYLLKDDAMELYNPANSSVLPVDTASAKIESDLYDATENLAGNLSTRSSALVEINDADGWYIQLKESSGFVGEKVLSSPVIFRNTISFTTTIPRGVSGACVYTPTLNRFYSINMFDATPSGLLTEVDPSDPDAVIPITGTRSVDIDTDDAIVDEVQVVTMSAESAGYQDTNSTSGSTDGVGDSEQEVCAKVYAKQTEMLKMCYAPTKVFWKETGRDEVDCRFDDVAACQDVPVTEAEEN